MKGKLPGWELRVRERKMLARGYCKGRQVRQWLRKRNFKLFVYPKSAPPNLQHMHTNILPTLNVCKKWIYQLHMNIFKYIDIHFFLAKLLFLWINTAWRLSQICIISITFRLYVCKTYYVYYIFYWILKYGLFEYI